MIKEEIEKINEDTEVIKRTRQELLAELDGYKIKARHRSFIVIESPVGRLSKVCNCGHQTKGFIELTNPRCMECGQTFKRA